MITGRKLNMGWLHITCFHRCVKCGEFTPIMVALMFAFAVGCHPTPAPKTHTKFWKQVCSGEVRNFMLYGFKVGIQPGGYWPVAANVFVPAARLEDAKQASAQLRPLIASRLAGLEKDDLAQTQKRARIEDAILADTRSRLPKLSVEKVFLSLDVK